MVKLIYANSKNADMYYAVKADIHDPFFLLEINGQVYVFLDYREYDAFKEKNTRPAVKPVLLNPLIEESKKITLTDNRLCQLVWLILQQYEVDKAAITVPSCFPLDLADFLRSQNIQLEIANTFYPQRASKNDSEIKAIAENIKNTCLAYELIEDILKKSVIQDNKIIYNQQTLTSQYLKKEVEKLLLEKDLVLSEGIIISSGKQSAMPHHGGSGEILPYQPIICDIFPQSRINGYFADMTRTYFKGEPAAELIKMYQAVSETQESALAAVAPTKTGQQVHQVSVDSFLSLGFAVGDQGFIHGTGHGLGLEIHELPYINAEADKLLQPGNIITIEPGLYYPELGGIRIEDVAVVTANGFLNLTDYPKDLKIF